MILNMVGGGGAGLNFSVSAYASKDVLPASAGNNAIAVITENTITSWAFSATEPESPSEGMVWFMVGKSSTVAFNAIKKNTILIYPLSAKQYISGVWVSKDALSFIGGEWMAWATELIMEGFRTKIMEKATYTLPTDASPVLDISATYENSSKQGRCIAEIVEAQDLTNVVRVVFTVDELVYLGNKTYVFQFYVATETQTDDWTMTYTKSVDVNQNMENATVTIDVSDLTGNHYIGLYVRGSYSPTGTQSCKISSIRLEN